MIALLDVNVLLALAFPNHQHWPAATQWFRRERENGWATCAVTQAGFLRIATTVSAVGTIIAMRDAVELLVQSTADPRHQFWPLDSPPVQIRADIRNRMLGPKHVTDAQLLDLAIRRGGKLVTFDQRLEYLLPPQAGLGAHLEVIREHPIG